MNCTFGKDPITKTKFPSSFICVYFHVLCTSLFDTLYIIINTFRAKNINAKKAHEAIVD